MQTPRQVVDKSHRSQLLLNAVVAGLLAQTAMVFVHELAHLVAGAALGHPSRMYAFGVDHFGDIPVADEAVMAMAGPVFSLVTGFVMAIWTPLRRRGDFAHLLWLFFAFASMQEMVGYLVITPFGAGDTGVTAALLNIPLAGQFAICALGIAGMFLTARGFATHMARHAGPDELGLRNAMTLFPWIASSVASALLSLLYLAITPADVPPESQVAIMAASTAILVFAPMAHIFSRAVRDVAHEPLALARVPVVGLVALGVLVAVNIVLSIWGLPLG
ncbi:hypothetical protein ACPCG0_13030 [Propionibacteriaceae bacterium Y1923]